MDPILTLVKLVPIIILTRINHITSTNFQFKTSNN